MRTMSLVGEGGATLMLDGYELSLVVEGLLTLDSSLTELAREVEDGFTEELQKDAKKSREMAQQIMRQNSR